ncbi:MAG: hypothetical protein KJO97_08150 [Acidimicrobiia bacterium]|nr:hypothetical protein [Acidimicrobiia bacterium]
MRNRGVVVVVVATVVVVVAGGGVVVVVVPGDVVGVEVGAVVVVAAESGGEVEVVVESGAVVGVVVLGAGVVGWVAGGAAGGRVGVLGSASSASADRGAAGGSFTCDVTWLTAAVPTPDTPMAAKIQMMTVMSLRTLTAWWIGSVEGNKKALGNP